MRLSPPAGVLLIGAALAVAPAVLAQAPPGSRLPIGVGSLLLLADTTTGLTLWATRSPRPGHRPTPDFVGWFEPDAAAEWVVTGHAVLAETVEPDAEGWETERLTARDGGFLTLIRLRSPADADRPFLLAFGHPAERQRWMIEATQHEVTDLLDLFGRIASRGRLAPPPNLGYANPTHRAVTPDRDPASRPPTIRTAKGGEVWLSADLDPDGFVTPGSTRVLWSAGSDLSPPILAAMAGYRYRRKDGGQPERLRVYQRFTVRAKGER